MAKRGRDDEPPPIAEPTVGISGFRTAALAAHPTGIFQSRWADFHVRELSEADGTPLAMTELPTSVPQAGILTFVLYKENRTTADALLQLASASGCPMNAFAVAGAKDRRAVTRLFTKKTAEGTRRRAWCRAEAP